MLKIGLTFIGLSLTTQISWSASTDYCQKQFGKINHLAISIPVNYDKATSMTPVDLCRLTDLDDSEKQSISEQSTELNKVEALDTYWALNAYRNMSGECTKFKSLSSKHQRCISDALFYSSSKVEEKEQASLLL